MSSRINRIPVRSRARTVACGALAVVFGTAALADTDIQVTETSYTVVANQGDEATRTLTLQVPAGSNAVHYSVIAEVDGLPQPLMAKALIARSRVVPHAELDWAREHVANRLIVCYDDQGVAKAGARFIVAPDAVRARTEMHKQLGATLHRRIPLINADVVDLPLGADLRAAAEQYRRMPGVTHVQPDYIVSIADFPDDPNMPFGPSSLGAPDDQILWGLHTAATDGAPVRTDVIFDYDIDAPEAWEITHGSSNVIVAVIDTGVDYTHPDLIANMWTNTGEIPGNGIDDDANGYVDDVHGYDFRNDDGDPMDDHFHGTHCAGTIGAVGDNGVDVVGVNWNVRIMGMKFLGSGGSGYSSDAAACLDYAVMMGADITSNSWGGGSYDAALLTAIQNAGAAGQLFVAAAGNDSFNTDSYPYYPQGYQADNIVSVGALQRAGGLASFSNYGLASVDIAAPGEAIWSTNVGGGLRVLDGTSMATPHVAGVAALLKSVKPSATVEELQRWLYDGADVDPLLDGEIGGSRHLNAYGALNQALSPWFEMSQREGILDSSAGQMQLPITFQTFRVPAGSYTGTIRVLDLSYDNRLTAATDVPFTFTLNYVPQPPLAYGQSLQVADYNALLVTLTGDDPNPEDTVTYTIASLPTGGTLVDDATGTTITGAPFNLGAAHKVTYTPVASGSDYSDAFTFTTSDGTATSSPATISIDVIAPPAAPTNLAVTSTVNARADLTWDPVANAIGYNLYWAEYPEGPWFQSNSTPITGTSTSWGSPWEATWNFKVTALRDAGAESPYSSVVSVFTNHSSVVDLQGAGGDGYVELQYNPDPGYYTYVIVYRSLNRYTGYVDIGLGNQGEFLDLGVQNGTTYFYRVGFYDPFDNYFYSWSPPVEVTPSVPLQQPQNLEIDWVSNQVLNMVWDYRTGVYGYAVYRATAPGGPYQIVNYLQDSEYLDEGLTNYVTYYYRVAEIDQGLNPGPQSATVSGTPYDPNEAPPAPTNLYFDEVVSDSITVGWDAIGSVSEYRIYRSENGGAYAFAGTRPPTMYPAFDDPTVQQGSTYCYQVSAVSYNDVEGPLSIEFCATAPDPSTPPPAPANTTITDVQNTEITIGWDPVVGVSGYYIYRSDQPGGTFSSVGWVSNYAPVNSAFTDTGLTPATQYCYYVRAMSWAGVLSNPSPTECGTTTGAPSNTPPTANPDSAQVIAGALVEVFVLANDTDLETPGALEVVSVNVISGQGSATVTGQNTTVTYTAPAGYQGTTQLQYTITDGMLTDSSTITIDVQLPPNTPPNINDDDAITTYATAVDIDVLANDSDDDPGDVLTLQSVTQPAHGSAAIVGSLVRYTPGAGFLGSDSFTYTATDGQDPGNATVNVLVASAIRMEWGTTTASGSWSTVNLNGSYTNMVVVCTVQRVNNSSPVVTRVRLTGSTSSFDVRLQNPGDGDPVVADTVHYIVTQAGVYNENGVVFEAATYNSTITDNRKSWQGQSRSYAQSYSNPVVIGQVMSANDPDWSTFWSRGSNRANPPDSSNFYAGKHVAEDNDRSRANETVGYLIFEQSAGVIGGVPFEAVLGFDSVTSNPSTYSFTQSFTGGPSVVVASQSAMDGNEGAWAILPSAPGLSSAQFEAEEDQIRDNEQSHTSEQVAYVAFAGTGSSGAAGITGAGSVNSTPHLVGFEPENLRLALALDSTSGAHVSDDGRVLTLVGERWLSVDLGGAVEISDDTFIEFLIDQPTTSNLKIAFEGADGQLGEIDLPGAAPGVREVSLNMADYDLAGCATTIVLTLDDTDAGEGVMIGDFIIANHHDPRLDAIYESIGDTDPAPPGGFSLSNDAGDLTRLIDALRTRDASLDLNRDGDVTPADLLSAVSNE